MNEKLDGDDPSWSTMQTWQAALLPMKGTSTLWTPQSIRHYLRLLSSILRRFCYALVPQLVRTIYFNDPLPQTKPHPTSWLNGLRGLASLFVFNEHFFYMFCPTIVLGFGTRPQDKYLYQLPVFELFSDGIVSVITFFTVAGYVCSYKSLRAMTLGTSDPLKSLPASMFRRWFRLYLPVFCSTLCISTLAYIGAFEPIRHYFDPKVKDRTFPGPGAEPQPAQFPTLLLQFKDWWSVFSGLCNFWIERPNGPPMDLHLWTIVHEYRNSMLLYMSLVGISPFKPWARILLLAFFGYICLFVFAHYETVCFFYGAIIAQVDALRERNEKASADLVMSDLRLTQPERPRWMSVSRAKNILRFIAFCLAIYLMSFPMRGARIPAPLYKIVLPFIPRIYGKGTAVYFPKQMGVLLFTYLLTTIPMQARKTSIWHRILTCQVTTYLGTIMFGLFLIHGTVMHTFGFALPHVIWRNIGGQDTMAKYLFGLFGGYLINLVVSLWLADVWTREVEGRCVVLTNWIEGLFLMKPA